MIIFENKSYQTRSDKPDSDWTGNARYIIPDGSELALKVQELYPYYDFVQDNDGSLIDVEAIEKPPEPEQDPTSDELVNLILGVNSNE